MVHEDGITIDTCRHVLLLSGKVATKQAARMMALSGHDEGPGIPGDMLPEIFKRHTSAGANAGLGIGMYMAKGIATAHGGGLAARSAPGEGTTFSLELPSRDDLGT